LGSTPRTIILDGYNVILRSPAFQPDERRDLAMARDKLVNLLSWALGTAGAVEFVIVFDGADVAPPHRKAAKVSGSARVDVRFSKPPRTADDDIKALVEQWAESRPGLTVVTSDIEVATHARANGAAVVLSDLFAASLFRERAEEQLNAAIQRGKPGAGARGGGKKAKRGHGQAGSPTARGSDAEDKPEGVSKKNAEEWLKLFEEQKKSEQREE
jgi:predicted RNA-binding protein with PIN domain